MAKKIIGVDSCLGLNYIGVVSGFDGQITYLFNNVNKLFENRELHWRKIPESVRKKCYKDMFELMNSSRVRFYLFETKKPKHVIAKVFYLREVPVLITKYFEDWFRDKFGIAEIKVHNDFRFRKVPNSSESFARALLDKLCMRLTGSRITIRKIRNQSKFITKIKSPITNNELEIFSEVDYTTDKSIQLCDILMGYSLNYKLFRDKFKPIRI